MNQLGLVENKMKKVPSITKGELFICREHQLDYRLLCEECVLKHKLFKRAIELSKSINNMQYPTGEVKSI